MGAGGATGGGPVAWIAPAFVPDLGAVLERGGGEVDATGRGSPCGSGGRGIARATPGAPARRRPARRCPARRRAGPHRHAYDRPACDCPAATAPATAAARPRARPCDRPARSRARPRRPPVAPSATRHWRSTPAAATASTPSGCCGCRRRPSPAAPPSPPRARAAPPTAACSSTRCSSAWISAGPSSRAPEAVRPPRRRRVCTRARSGRGRRAGRARAALRRERAVCPAGPRHQTRREERFSFPLSADPAQPLVVGALDVLARDRGGGCWSSTTRAIGCTEPTRLSSSSASTRPSGWSTRWRRCGPAPRRSRSPTASWSSPTRRSRSASSAARCPSSRRGWRARPGVVERRFEVTPAPYRGLCAGCPAEGGLCSWPLAMTRRESPDTLF